MNFDEIIRNRRATPPRFIAKGEISKEDVQQLLESANWAPSHKKTEPWRFIVYRGVSKLKLAESIHNYLIEKSEAGEAVNLRKAEKFRANLERVPVAVAIILERDVAGRVAEWEEIAAVSMAVQNMWLKATAMNLGAFWATPQFLPALHTVLELKPGQKLLGLFYVGEVAMDYPSPGRGEIGLKVIWKE